MYTQSKSQCCCTVSGNTRAGHIVNGPSSISPEITIYIPKSVPSRGKQTASKEDYNVLYMYYTCLQNVLA